MDNRLSEFVNDHYLLRVHSARCSHCGAVETWSEVFLVKTHPDLTATTTARILRPMVGHHALGESLPIARTKCAMQVIPCCDKCVDDLVATPLPQSNEYEWQRAIRAEAQRANAQREAKAKSAPTAKRADPTALADFLSSIG